MSEKHLQTPDFTAEWLLREPALALCFRFAANPMHWLPTVVIVEELWQAMFTLSNQELAQAKLAWWADEADLAVSGAPRHPLTLALFAGKADLSALPALVQAAQEWITLTTAPDANGQRQQFAELATAASELVGEGDCAAIWTELALKRQLPSFAKPDRYGPSILSRAALAEFQLKASQIAEARHVGAALAAKLTNIQHKLRESMPTQAQRMQSATRAYALLHAREAALWAKMAITPQFDGFSATKPGMIGLMQAWWVARA